MTPTRIHHSPEFDAKPCRKAFSLLELLMVMGVIGVVLGFTLPAVTNLAQGNSMTRAIVGVAGFLDLAREQAVSQNTYTWVVMAPGEGADPAIHLAMIGSKDGSNTLDGTTLINLDGTQTYDLSAGATNLILLQRATSFPKTTLGVLGTSPGPVVNGLTQLSPGISFRLPGGASGSSKALNSRPENQRVVRFSPSGEAQVSEVMVQAIEVGIQSMKGTQPDAVNVSAIRLSGLTGQTRVYRK